MREIKFRAWHKENKIMYTVHYMDLKENCRSVGLMKNKETVRSDDRRDVILMQFTGIKDKNGKEIYEGDNYLCSNGKTKGEIKWDENGFYCKNILIDGTGEVTGNIHEDKQ